MEIVTVKEKLKAGETVDLGNGIKLIPDKAGNVTAFRNGKAFMTLPVKDFDVETLANILQAKPIAVKLRRRSRP